jgi:hypothetical protein
MRDPFLILPPALTRRGLISPRPTIGTENFSSVSAK